jgi:predicted AAA+ superfamily ATPase
VKKIELYYIRDQQKREVDFLTLRENELEFLIEVKEAADEISSSLKHFHSVLKTVQTIQLVHNTKREFDTAEGIQLRKSASWLSNLEN